MSLAKNGTCLRMKYIPSEWTPDAKILIADVKGGDISARKGFFSKL